MTKNDLSERVEAVKQITALFNFERVVYVSIVVFCLLILLGSVVAALVRGKMGAVELNLMLGSGGGVAFMTSQLIRMWNRAMSVLGAPKEG